MKQLDDRFIINQNIEMLAMKVIKGGMCSYVDIKEGKIDYEDILRMNDYLSLVHDLEEEAIERNKKDESK